MTTPQDRVGQMVRGTHPYCYKAGEWGRIVMVVPAREQDAWLVSWPNGDSDVWAPDATEYGYEFKEASP